MARPQISSTACAFLLVLSACNKPPGVEAGGRITPSDQPVQLLPLDKLLAQAQSGAASDATAAALVARAARLRARAVGS